MRCIIIVAMKSVLNSCVLALVYAAVLAAQGTPAAQGGPDEDKDEKILKTFQNPIGDLISVPFQNNTNFPIGQYSRVENQLLIEPVIPVHLSSDWTIISRWITPVVYQPREFVANGGANGLGDLNPSFFLSPSHPGALIWGFGPTFLLPTATDPTLGQGKWGAGPSIVLLAQPQHFTLGLVANNIWSFAGNDRRERVNQFYTQWFVTYNMKNHWFISEAPIITANWLTPRNKWLVPFGMGIGKMTRLGKQRVVFELHTYYNLIHPQELPYPKWQVRLQVAFLFPEER